MTYNGHEKNWGDVQTRSIGGGHIRPWELRSTLACRRVTPYIFADSAAANGPKSTPPDLELSRHPICRPFRGSPPVYDAGRPARV